MGRRNGNILRKIMAPLFAAILLWGTGKAAVSVDVLAADTVQSGTGWTLDSEGTLTVESNAGMTGWNAAVKADAKLKTQVRSVALSDGVTTIESDCFKNYVNLTEIEIPDTVTSVENSAFYGCKSLTSITIPEGVTEIKDYTFYQCTSLADVTIESKKVTRIGENAFRDCKSLTGITIPESVTSIGKNAFWSCRSLTDITIPSGVTSIGAQAFCSCSSLTDITIPSGVTSIEACTFQNCSSLKSITIPDSVESIGMMAFCYCSSLKNITIPEKVTSIGSNTFDSCKSLTDITIPEGLESIGMMAFSDCSSLKNIMLPDSMTSIGHRAFGGCSSLTGIKIPSGVTKIESWTFRDCSRLAKIELPDSVTSIGGVAFCDCSSLTDITIPSGVTSIESSTFDGCSSLTDITIPSGVTIIGENAFSGCSGLTEVTIPENVTGIGQGAFLDCSKLTKVEMLGETPPETISGEGLPPDMIHPFFENCPCVESGKKGILVPAGKVEIYAAAEGWSGYADHITDGTPEITAQPADCSVKNGGTAAFSVTVTGLGSFTYRWQVDKNDARGFADIENAASAAYTISVADKNCDGYKYRCVIANARGSVTSEEAVLTVTDSDAEKVEAAKKVVEEALEGITATNDTAKEDIQRAVDEALDNAGITDVTVTVGDLTKTEATKDTEGSVSGRVAIECGSETDSVEIRKTIEKLPISDAEKVAAAKKVVEEALEGITATNDTAKEDIQRAVDEALDNAGITGVTVTVGDLDKKDATAEAEGSVSVSVAIECGRETDSVEIRKTIEKLPISDAEKVAAAKKVVEEALEGITATNDTAKEDIQRAVDEALDNAGITGVTVTVGDLDKKDATAEAEGSISVSVAIECGRETDSVEIRKTIEKLPISDAEKVEAAKKVVEETLEGITATNDTAKEDIQRAVDEALDNAGITGVTVTVGDLTKTEATKDTEGSVSGSVAIECGSEADSVEIRKTIEKLPISDAEKVAAAKKAVEKALEGITATNDTAKEDIQRAVDEALDNAGITGVTVTVGDMTKTEATKDTEGSVSGRVAIECGSEADSVEIRKTIEKLPISDAEKVAAAKKAVEKALEGITATNDTAKEDIQRAVDEALDNAGITDVTVTVGDLTKTEATKDTEGSVSGRVAIECGSETDSVEIDKKIPAIGNGGQPDPEAGTVDKEVQTDGKAPATQISTSANELAEMLLTDTEKRQVANGTDIKIVLDVRDAEGSVSSGDKALVETAINGGSAAEGFAIGQYLDISLYKQIGENRTDITETKEQIVITINVPESLRGTGRTFAVIRVHNGETVTLNDLDDDPNTVTVATDRFSTYVLVYHDAGSDSGGNGGSDGNGGSSGGNGSSGGSGNGGSSNNNNNSGNNSNNSSNNSNNNGTSGGNGTDPAQIKAVTGPKTDDRPLSGLFATVAMFAGGAYLLQKKRRNSRHL